MSSRRVLEAMAASLLADCVRALVRQSNAWYQNKKLVKSDDRSTDPKKETATSDLNGTANNDLDEGNARNGEKVEKAECKCNKTGAQDSERGRNGAQTGKATVSGNQIH